MPVKEIFFICAITLFFLAQGVIILVKLYYAWKDFNDIGGPPDLTNIFDKKEMPAKDTFFDEMRKNNNSFFNN